ncbi:hypothetical protein BaRGS_00021647, partial [Batillaria attramentaria]
FVWRGTRVGLCDSLFFNVEHRIVQYVNVWQEQKGDSVSPPRYGEWQLSVDVVARGKTVIPCAGGVVELIDFYVAIEGGGTFAPQISRESERGLASGEKIVKSCGAKYPPDEIGLTLQPGLLLLEPKFLLLTLLLETQLLTLTPEFLQVPLTLAPDEPPN